MRRMATLINEICDAVKEGSSSKSLTSAIVISLSQRGPIAIAAWINLRRIKETKSDRQLSLPSSGTIRGYNDGAGLMKKLLIATALVFTALPYTFDGVTPTLSKAHAIIGRPLTPFSVAGVHRRAVRRTFGVGANLGYRGFYHRNFGPYAYGSGWNGGGGGWGWNRPGVAWGGWGWNRPAVGWGGWGWNRPLYSAAVGWGGWGGGWGWRRRWW